MCSNDFLGSVTQISHFREHMSPVRQTIRTYHHFGAMVLQIALNVAVPGGTHAQHLGSTVAVVNDVLSIEQWSGKEYSGCDGVFGAHLVFRSVCHLLSCWYSLDRAARARHGASTR